MNKLLLVVVSLVLCLSTICEAKGGFSSSGRGGFSSSGRSFSSSPSTSIRSGGVTTTRTYSNRVTTTNHYYGGMGMGYGYSNGLITGMIIGNMMHPYNTVMYTGMGVWNNNALLYPDGRVVSYQGYLVGTYTNGVFTSIQNGPYVAQAVPNDAIQQQQDNAGEGSQQQPRPIIVQNNTDFAGYILLAFLLLIFLCFIFIIILGA